MNKIILADSQAIFRRYRKVLAMDEDLRIIAQCTDLERMYHAITTFPTRLLCLQPRCTPTLRGSACCLRPPIAGASWWQKHENAVAYLQQGFRGVVFRSVTGRHWWNACAASLLATLGSPRSRRSLRYTTTIWSGPRARPLTPKEMRIVALIVQGCKNREIALRLKTTEQVIKTTCVPSTTRLVSAIV